MPLVEVLAQLEQVPGVQSLSGYELGAEMLSVTGLKYLPNYISPTEHDALVQTIDSGKWRTDLARRTQHYGFIYDYKAKSVDPAMSLGPLPPWLARIAERAKAEGLCADLPDQAIINEYLAGQGIAAHIDCKPCFAETVMSLSLISPAMMDFKNGAQTASLWIEPRSLLVMQGEARYAWSHGISKRKSDLVRGQRVARARRLSVTFRKVIV